MTVLVTAAGKHGTTAEIAEAIARVLDEQGVPAELVDIEKVTDLGRYDAVVLGSAVYMGHWVEPARKFVERYGNDLAERKTWLFSSGPTGAFWADRPQRCSRKSPSFAPTARMTAPPGGIRPTTQPGAIAERVLVPGRASPALERRHDAAEGVAEQIEHPPVPRRITGRAQPSFISMVSGRFDRDLARLPELPRHSATVT